MKGKILFKNDNKKIFCDIIFRFIRFLFFLCLHCNALPLCGRCHILEGKTFCSRWQLNLIAILEGSQNDNILTHVILCIIVIQKISLWFWNFTMCFVDGWGRVIRMTTAVQLTSTRSNLGSEGGVNSPDGSALYTSVDMTSAATMTNQPKWP